MLDEAQRIKTPGRLVTNAAKALKADFRLAMTGTPVENTFHDLWSIMDFCSPGVLGSAKDFGREFALSGSWTAAEAATKGEEVRRRIGVYLKRRLKSERLDEFPQKFRSDDLEQRDRFERFGLARAMPSVQAGAYRAVYDDAQRQGPMAQGMMLRRIYELKRISDHPRSLKESSDECLPADESARMIVLGNILDVVRDLDEKALIFAEYKTAQRMIRCFVEDRYGVEVSVINGDMPVGREAVKRSGVSRAKEVERFNRLPGFAVIVMSPLAGGVGLTVTGANHVVHFSRHWNPAREEQATDRTYRIGQTRDVYVYYPMAVLPDIKTFDVILSDLLRTKRQVAEATLFPSLAAEVRVEDVWSSAFVTAAQQHEQ